MVSFLRTKFIFWDLAISYGRRIDLIRIGYFMMEEALLNKAPATLDTTHVKEAFAHFQTQCLNSAI